MPTELFLVKYEFCYDEHGNGSVPPLTHILLRGIYRVSEMIP